MDSCARLIEADAREYAFSRAYRRDGASPGAGSRGPGPPVAAPKGHRACALLYVVAQLPLVRYIHATVQEARAGFRAAICSAGTSRAGIADFRRLPLALREQPASLFRTPDCGRNSQVSGT